MKPDIQRYWWWPLDQKSATLNLDLIDVRVPIFIIFSFLQSFVPILVDYLNNVFSSKILKKQTAWESLKKYPLVITKILISFALLSGWSIVILVILLRVSNNIWPICISDKFNVFQGFFL